MERHTSTRSSNPPSPSLQEALEYARAAHEGQRRRQDGRPFIEHPVAVVELLAGHDFSDEVLAAGYLHDTFEKCESVSLEELEGRFGAAVAATVEALSEDTSLEDYDERKRLLRARALSSGREVAIVYAADRLANIRDWQALDAAARDAAASRLGTDFSSRRSLWREDLHALNDLDPDLPFLGEIEVALRDLR